MAPPGGSPPPEEEAKARLTPRKLFKRRPKDAAAGPEMPERLRCGDDAGEEEITATSEGPTMYMDMNQSIFGLIAAAGSRVDFTDRFQPPSSDEEDGGGDGGSEADDEHVAKTTVFGRHARSGRSSGKQAHRRKLSGHKLLRSLPALPRLAKSKLRRDHTKAHAEHDDDDDKSDDGDSIAQSVGAAAADDKRPAPVMSRMLEAQAEMAARPSFEMEGLSDEVGAGDEDEGEVSPLARKLKEIFEFDESEEVIEGTRSPGVFPGRPHAARRFPQFADHLTPCLEYPCWLLQCVLLQGFMYITTKHICFYAYLPKKGVSLAKSLILSACLTLSQNEVAKSGYLSKSGRRNPKYNRYWFRLKGDVLSYYADTTNVYFPNGQIDLRYAISVDITDKDKEGLNLSVSTHHRTYHLRADSAPSAKEWVKAIQRVIFRSHNDGDSVKISLPIENVIDIEDIHMLEFADTCKIRVLDNDETCVLDEVRRSE